MAAGRQGVAFSGIAVASAKRLQCPERGWMEWRGGRTNMTAKPPLVERAHHHQFSEGRCSLRAGEAMPCSMDTVSCAAREAIDTDTSQF